MIKRNNEFLKEIEKISRTVVESGKVNYGNNRLKESFFKQLSQLMENHEGITCVEYGTVEGDKFYDRTTFGIKIKNKDILLADIIYAIECSNTCNRIITKFPELIFEEAKAAQRFITMIMSGLECEDNEPIINKNDYFIKEIEKISERVIESGKSDYDRKSFEKGFFYQGSHTPCNLESMKHIEYGEVKKNNLGNTRVFGIKVKDKDILLSDIVDFLDNDEINKSISNKYPELTTEEIKAAQKVFRVIFKGFECREVDMDKDIKY